MTQNPTSPTWQNIEKLLDELLDMSAGEREKRLSELDKSAPDYAFAARSALSAATSNGILDKGLDGFAGDLLRDLVEKEARSELGSMLSVYRLKEEIGRGGMGIVYRASREDGEFEQEVAIKRLPLVLMGERGVSKFKEERTILAGIRHPFIAQLLDGGIDDDGLPYIIMELVDEGLRVDRYVAENKYTLKDRLKLIKKICDAVSYLHVNLITHGDIKPGNVLVRPDGHPKLIDFGISQLAAEPGARPMRLNGATPSYGAPEQLNGGPLTTGADVFALGATMETVLKASLADNDEQIPAEVHSIITKCRSVDLEKRYTTVKALVDDIDAYLTQRPVSAVANTFGYKINKFIRRNWLPVLAGAAVSTAMVAGTLISTHQAQIAKQEAKRATTVSDFLTSLFSSTAESTYSDEDPTIYDLLEQADKKLDTELSDEPAIQADLQAIFGRAYTGMLYDHKKALENFEDVLAYDREFDPRNELRTMSTLSWISKMHYEMGDREKATEFIDEAIALDLKDGKPDLPGWTTKFLLAEDSGDIEEARNAVSMLEQYYTNEFGADSSEFAIVLETQARLKVLENDIPTSIELRRQAIDMRERHDGGAWITTQRMRNNLAVKLHDVGRLEEAAEIYEKVIAITHERLGPEHAEQIGALNNLGAIYLDLAQVEKAKSVFENAVTIAERDSPPGRFQRIALELNLSKSLVETGSPAIALERLRRNEATAIETVGQDHVLTYVIQRAIALAELDMGNIQEARRLIDFARPQLPSPARGALAARIDAEIAIAEGQNEIALAAINDSLELLAESESSKDWMFAESKLIERQIRLNLGQTVDEQQYANDVNLLEETMPTNHRSRKWFP